MATGLLPTGIGGPGVFLGTWIGVTEASLRLPTYSVLLSGVMAAELGNPPTGMADSAVLVDTRIGVTVLSLAFTV
jgi:hypothetical protein